MCILLWNRFWPNNKSRMYLLENTGTFDFLCIVLHLLLGLSIIHGMGISFPGNTNLKFSIILGFEASVHDWKVHVGLEGLMVEVFLFPKKLYFRGVGETTSVAGRGSSDPLQESAGKLCKPAHILKAPF